MKCTISQHKAFKILEWILFIGFTFVVGWFASGVIKQFFTSKTSFSQHEIEVKEYPVVVIVFSDYKASEVNLTNVDIFYRIKQDYEIPWIKDYVKLKIGKNHFLDQNSKTVKVILESLENV